MTYANFYTALTVTACAAALAGVFFVQILAVTGVTL